ncbi:MAG: helix-turn-helix domain-containing protein [Methylotenera sp.]
MNTQQVTIIKEVALPPQPATYLSDSQIAQRYSVSRQTVWRWAANDPKFPSCTKLSPGCTRWKLSDIEAWEAAK